MSNVQTVARTTRSLVDATLKLGKAARGFQRDVIEAVFGAAKDAPNREDADKLRKGVIGAIKDAIREDYSEDVVEFVNDTPEKGDDGLREFCKMVAARYEDGEKIEKFDRDVFYLYNRIRVLDVRANDAAPLLDCLYVDGGQKLIDGFMGGKGIEWVKRELAALTVTSSVGAEDAGEGEGAEDEGEMSPAEKFEHLLSTALDYGAKNVEGFAEIAMERLMARTTASK